MASLTETTALMRTLIKISLIAIVVFVIGFYSYKLIVYFLTPKNVPTAPTLRFGVLPHPNFPTSEYTLPQFTVETPTGKFEPLDITDKLISSSQIATVPALLRPKINFANKQEIIKRAANLGFITPPEQTDPNTLLFTDPQYPLRSLQVDIATTNYTYLYDYAQEPAVFSTTDIASRQGLIDEALNQLFLWNTIPNDLRDGQQTVLYYEYTDNRLSPVEREQQAQAAQVNFLRRPVYNIPVVYDKPNGSNIVVLIGSSREDKKRILQTTYLYYAISPTPKPVDETDKKDQNATYPLKTIAQAFDELKSGGGYIAQHDNSATVAITQNPTLAYYEDDTNLLLYPVYLFMGDNFVAYVPAIESKYFSSKNNQRSNQEAVQGISTQQLLLPNQEDQRLPQNDSNSKARPKRFSDLLRQTPVPSQ